MRRVVLVVIVVLLLVIGIVAAWQGRFDDGLFEFGVQREFAGVIYETPVPMLRVAGGDGRAATNYVLVGSGKFGLPTFARGHDGKKVSFKGTLIQKGPATMIEVNDAASFNVLGEPTPAEQRGKEEPLGEATLTGELVDTKCWFGVMRPATGKVHRACAVRCLSGGAPPGLLVRDQHGNGVVVLLTGADGQPLKFDVQWAARVVVARGALEVRDSLAILRVGDLRLAD
ncbi:MAG: hypothetical protein HY301_07000 [Verrucomicrobia bacterium]|nr:hypothetical protein [Verrucomicrobiota bacterium]